MKKKMRRMKKKSRERAAATGTRKKTREKGEH